MKTYRPTNVKVIWGDIEIDSHTEGSPFVLTEEGMEVKEDEDNEED